MNSTPTFAANNHPGGCAVDIFKGLAAVVGANLTLLTIEGSRATFRLDCEVDLDMSPGNDQRAFLRRLQKIARGCCRAMQQAFVAPVDTRDGNDRDEDTSVSRKRVTPEPDATASDEFDANANDSSTAPPKKQHRIARTEAIGDATARVEAAFVGATTIRGTEQMHLFRANKASIELITAMHPEMQMVGGLVRGGDAGPVNPDSGNIASMIQRPQPHLLSYGLVERLGVSYQHDTQTSLQVTCALGVAMEHWRKSAESGGSRAGPWTSRASLACSLGTA